MNYIKGDPKDNVRVCVEHITHDVVEIKTLRTEESVIIQSVKIAIRPDYILLTGFYAPAGYRPDQADEPDKYAY